MGVHELAKKLLGLITGFFQIVYWYLEALYRQFVPPPMKSIDNETILVTGAVGGIGKEICRYLVQCGTNIKLVIWDLNQTELEKLAGELRSRGASGLKVIPMSVDISSKEKINQACQQIKDTVGSCTIIFNNAGTSAPGTFLQLADPDIEKVMQVNLMSHFWIIRQFLPEMITTNHGRIVNICSMGGLKPGTHGFPYYASKFAVNGYTEALKMELRLPYYNYTGIKFSTVYPYFVQTPLINSICANPESPTSLPKAFHKFQTPQEVAEKTVDGMRREYEYIYCPDGIPLVIVNDYFMPMKLRRVLEEKHLTSFLFKDPAEYDRIVNAPYAPPQNVSGSGSGSSNGKSKKKNKGK